MAEYIEREALKKVLTRYLNAPHVQMGHSVGQSMRIAIKSCIELLDNEYAADVAPVKRGKWERVVPSKNAAKWSNKVSCSICHREGYTRYNYCPNCGAMMCGEGGEER